MAIGHRGRGQAAAVFLLGLVLAGCGTTYVSTKRPDAALIAGQGPAEVRAAIIRAIAGSPKGLATTESEEAGKIVARLGKKDSYARVAIEYTGSQYLVRYLDSKDFETKPGPDGDILVEKKYASLEKRLKDGIAGELGRPAREAAQAERNRREYELLLQQARTAQAQADAQAAQAATQPADPNTPVASPVQSPSVGAIAGAIAPHIQPPAVQYNSSVKRSDQSLTCCINGSLYRCPGQEAYQECLHSGPSKCTAAGRCK